MDDPISVARERRRQQRAEDGEVAMREYRAQEEAVRSNTARLRMLRLAALEKESAPVARAQRQLGRKN